MKQEPFSTIQFERKKLINQHNLSEVYEGKHNCFPLKYQHGISIGELTDHSHKEDRPLGQSVTG